MSNAAAAVLVGKHVRRRLVHSQAASRAMAERERYEAVMIRSMPSPFGALYGAAFYSTGSAVVAMFRKRSKVRFYTMHGEQVGPEQPNVAPAICAAAAAGWIPLRDPLRY